MRTFNVIKASVLLAAILTFSLTQTALAGGDLDKLVALKAARSNGFIQSKEGTGYGCTRSGFFALFSYPFT